MNARLRTNFLTCPASEALIRAIPHGKEDGRLISSEYREPFLGGGSIALTLTRETAIDKVWINDKDIGIACFWTAAIKYNSELQRLIRQFTPSVSEYDRLKKKLIDLKEMPTAPRELVEVGFEQLALNRISFSGLGTMSGGPLGGRGQKSNGGIASRWNPERLCKNLASIQARWMGVIPPLEIRASTCTNFDFAKLITDETCPALLYLDPPYFKQGHNLYQWCFSMDDHERMAGLLRKTRHAWVLSYDDCTEIRDLYSWASVEQIDAQYTIAGSRKKSELLIHPPHLPDIIQPIPKNGQVGRPNNDFNAVGA